MICIFWVVFSVFSFFCLMLILVVLFMNQGRGALAWTAGSPSAPCAPDPSRLCRPWTGSGRVAPPAAQRAAWSVRGRRPRCCLSASAHACCVLVSPDRLTGSCLWWVCPRRHPESSCALSTSCDARAHSGPEQPLEARTYASAGSVTVPQLRECSVRVRSL